MDRTAKIILTLAIISSLLAFGAILDLTPTTDEPRHLQMGRQILLEGSWERFDNSKMPVSVFNALPTIVSTPDARAISWIAPRLPQTLWLLGIVILTGLWVRSLAGFGAVIATTALVAFDPNLLAHSGLVTTDAPCTFFVIAVLFSSYLAVEKPHWKKFLIAGLLFGFAQAAKFTSIFLAPILFVAFVMSWLLKPKNHFNKIWLLFFVWVGAALFALNIAYGFSGTFSLGSDISWKSSMLSVMKQVDVPLPFPKPWLEGLDWVRYDDELGHGNVYSDGSLTADGQADHYLRIVSRKFPLVLVFLGFVGMIWPKKRSIADLFTIWPMLFLFGWFSLAFNFQIGVRYLLPLIPLLAIQTHRIPWKIVIVGAFLNLVWVLSWYPNLIPYHNIRLLNRVDAWKYLGDSNLDWGQAQDVPQKWLEENPNGLVDPDVPGPGPTLISANRLIGVLGDPSRMKCIRDYHQPKDHIKYVWYPINLTIEDFKVCYPSFDELDSGPIPTDLPMTQSCGDCLVSARVKGNAKLWLGNRSMVRTTMGSGEETLAVIVDEPQSIRVEGTLLGLYFDGRPVEKFEVKEK